MKKLAAVFGIIFCFCLFLALEFKPEKKYKVLKVAEGDKFYLDFNNNGKIDDNELVHLKNINTFPLRYGLKTEQYAFRYGLKAEDTFVLAYLAKAFSHTVLEGKEVTLIGPLPPFNPKYPYRFVEIKFEGKNFGQTLLENGLAFAYEGEGFNYYKTFEDVSKFKKLLKKYAGLRLMAVDNKYKIYHIPGCPKGLKIKEYSLLPENKIDKSYKKCKYCTRDVQKTIPQNAKNPYMASVQKTFNYVTVFFINPGASSRPSNLCATAACKVLIKNIDATKYSIDFALYGIDRQNEVIEALSRAKKRGVKIRGVVDSRPDGSFIYSDTGKLKEKFDTVLDYRAQNMHNKFFIFDKEKVFCGTMNISKTGSGGYNANTAVLINNKTIVDAYEREFNQMFNKKFGQKKADFSRKNISLGPDMKLSVYFSPAGDAYNNAILPLIKGAKREIYVGIFYLTHKGIIENLAAAKARGVDVKIIYDALGANNMKDKVKYLRSRGVSLKVENWGGKEHDKNMVIDGRYFVTGSANFSNSGMNYNDENILVFEGAQVAGFYREYFLKLFNSIDNKYLKYSPRAEGFESINSCYDGIDNNFDGKTDSEDIGCSVK